MNESKNIPAAAAGNSLKMLRAMVGIGIACALMIVLTFEGTLPIIKEKKAEALERAIFRVLPGIAKTASFVLDQNGQILPVEGAVEEGQVVYAGYDENDRLVGLAIEASGQGYADIIRILYGYDPERQEIIGFYVLESKETPGLGDKIEKDPSFLANFEGLDVSLNADYTALEEEVVPVKQGAKEQAWEVEGITGATISSRAIANIIDESAAYWAPLIYQHRDTFVSSEKAQQ